MSARVYLADLRHDFSGVLGAECMPLGVGYLKAVMDRDLPEVEARIFAYPEKLMAALRDDPPDVLMLANYMWSEWLSFHYAAVAKAIDPNILVVMGGPNISLEPDRQLAYMADHPEVDLYVLGEGDFLARDVVSEFLDAGKSITELGKRDIPSCIYRRPGGELVRTEMWSRHKQVEEIPSPWLSGALDEFFDGKLAPLLETNRGCPFQCTFCVQGVRWYTKVHNFTLERIQEEIDYIGNRVHEVCPNMTFLRLADSNFGTYARDVEIASHIGTAQARWGWPTFLDATTGKNRPERVIQALEKVNGALIAYQAVQSLDDITLKNIKRSNISNEAYEEVMIHVRGRGLRSLSDLILGLPGETLESHFAGISQLVDAGTNELHLFQAMMLQGSELETRECREKHRFDSRFRVLPKAYGEYDGQRVFDVDEIVISTETLSFADYIEARTLALTSSIFWNNSWFDDALGLARAFGIAPSSWLLAMRKALKRESGPIPELVADFVTETENELFPTRQAVVDFYQQDENWERLVLGEIGDNLMYKYRAKAAFFVWPEICAAAMDATRELLVSVGAADEIPDFEGFWKSLHEFTELKHAHGTTSEELLAPVETRLAYDIAAWIRAGMPKDVSPFRVADGKDLIFELPEESAAEIAAFLETWSSSLKGLTKGITRIRTTSLIRVPRGLDPPRKHEASTAA